MQPDLVEGSSPWRGGWLAARWPGKAVKVFFMHADPVAVYPQTFLGGLLGPERVDRLFGFFWRYLNSLNSKYDTAIVTNPALKERFCRFRPGEYPGGAVRRGAQQILAGLLRCHGAARDAGDLRPAARMHRC